MNSVVFTRPNAFLTRWTIDPNRRDEFTKIVTDALGNGGDLYDKIANFIYYGWSRDPNVWITLESFRDDTQLAELRKSEEFKSLFKRLLDCCSDQVVLENFSGIDGDRSVFERFPKGPSAVHPRSVHGVEFL